MSDNTVILNAAAIQRALTRIAHEIAERNETAQRSSSSAFNAAACTWRNGWAHPRQHLGP